MKNMKDVVVNIVPLLRRISHQFMLPSTKKALLFSSLYLTQAIPKGYLRFLPILMAEHGKSLRSISFLAFFSWGDWFKPLFGTIFDLTQISSSQKRKQIILLLQLMVIFLFTVSLLIPHPSYTQLAGLFSFCNLLTSIHDTAVDGLAVQFLKNTKERAMGGFGQYFGYKLGTLLTSGILTAVVGNHHQWICIGSIVVMFIVFLFTINFNIHEGLPVENLRMIGTPTSSSSSSSSSSSTASPKKILSDLSTMITSLLENHYWTFFNILLLLFYKFADHGLDFIWGPVLIQHKIDRKVVVKTQFIIGTIAAIIGSYFGSQLSTYFGSSSVALAVTSSFRLVPNCMQLLFSCFSELRNERFIALHALFENAIGSAVTGTMLTYLLDNSDSNYPATSYAFMNTINLIGMTLGEFSFAQFTHQFGLKEACYLGLTMNAVFAGLVYYQDRSERRHIH